MIPREKTACSADQALFLPKKIFLIFVFTYPKDVLILLLTKLEVSYRNRKNGKKTQKQEQN